MGTASDPFWTTTRSSDLRRTGDGTGTTGETATETETVSGTTDGTGTVVRRGTTGTEETVAGRTILGTDTAATGAAAESGSRGDRLGRVLWRPTRHGGTPPEMLLTVAVLRRGDGDL